VSATREDVVKEALTWINTPYHHGGDIKGVGVDCAMILIKVYCGLCLAPWFDPRPYSPQFFMHRDECIYLEWIAKYAQRVDVSAPGDIELFKFGRQPAHSGIVIDEYSMVHAYAPAHKVVLDERRALAGRLHSRWRPKPWELRA
jgi:cell wall-associated NlpC family hydrolase